MASPRSNLVESTPQWEADRWLLLTLPYVMRFSAINSIRVYREPSRASCDMFCQQFQEFYFQFARLVRSDDSFKVFLVILLSKASKWARNTCWNNFRVYQAWDSRNLSQNPFSTQIALSESLVVDSAPWRSYFNKFSSLPSPSKNASSFCCGSAGVKGTFLIRFFRARNHLYGNNLYKQKLCWAVHGAEKEGGRAKRKGKKSHKTTWKICIWNGFCVSSVDKVSSIRATCVLTCRSLQLLSFFLGRLRPLWARCLFIWVLKWALNTVNTQSSTSGGIKWCRCKGCVCCRPCTTEQFSHFQL